MPQNSMSIPFPHKGLSDETGFGDQPPMTTRVGVNVSSLDPRTGRLRGGQRAGMLRFMDSAVSNTGQPVQHLTSITYDVPLVTYTELTQNGQAVVPPVITSEASAITPGREVAYAIATDLAGNLYVLDGTSVVVKYNPSLTRLAVIPLPLDEDDQLVRKVIVDEDGSVYAAATVSDGDVGRVFKFALNANERYERVWTVELDGAVRDIAIRHGLLYVAQHFTEGDTFARLSQHDIITPEPLAIWERGIPYPVNGVAVQSDGSAVTVHERNLSRTASPGSGGFTGSNIIWTPYDLANAEQRIYAHIDAERLTGFSEGSRVRRWPDHRFEDWLSVYPSLPVLDDTVRNVRKLNLDEDSRTPPTYRAQAFNTKPGVVFDGSTIREAGDYGGESLTSHGSTDPTNKSAATGKLARQRALFPGVDGGAALFTWGFFMVIRPDLREDQVNVFGFQKSPRLSFGILCNAGQPPGTGAAGLPDLTPHSLGGIALDIPDPNLSAGGGPGGTVLYSGAGTTGGGFIEDANGAAQDVQCAIVAVIFGGEGQANACEFRVNGAVVDQFTLADDESWSPSDTRTTFGSPRHQQPYRASEDLYATGSGGAHETYTSYFGGLAECVVVLGDTGAAPHDTALTTDEIERVEGYLGHKWGISHLMLNAHTYSGNTLGNGAGVPGGVLSGPGQGPPVVDPETLVLSNPEPIVAKWGPNSGELRWAFSGSGVGYGVVVDSEDAVLNVGQRSPGADPADSEPIYRKLVDAGTDFRVNIAAEWDIRIAAIPMEGDEIVFDDGENTPVSFIFRIAPPADLPTIRYVLIGATEADTATNLYTDLDAIAGVTLNYTTEAPTSTTVHVVATKKNEVPNDGIVVVTGGAAAVTQTVQGVDYGAWTFPGTSTTEPSYDQPNLAVDSDGDLYVPVANVNKSRHVRRIDGTGNGDGTTEDVWEYTFQPSEVTTYGVAFGPTPPGESVPEHIYVTTDNGAIDGTSTVHKLRTLAETATGAASPRATTALGVSEGNIRTFTKGGAPVTPTGGDAIFGATSAFVSSVEVFGKLFLTDGYRAVVYDPKLNTVVAWEATSAGEVPDGILLLSRWNGRALAVKREERQNLYASKLGDAFNWDTDPPVLSSDQAWALNTPGAVGLMPEAINAIIPMNDEALLIGCDETAHILQGDPARDFGIHGGSSRSRVVLVSDTTGVAFGRPWAKDPTGNVYFMGSKGGVFVASPSGQTVEITEHWIERRMADIDFSVFRIEMAWDYRRNGLLVAQVPYTAFGVAGTRRWFWEKKVQEAFGSGGWWEHTSSVASVQPTALHNLDADEPGDRTLLVGCEDGRVRYFDDAAVDDDGHRILSEVLMGPIVPSDMAYKYRFSHAQLTLAADQGGCRLQGFVSDTADVLGEPLYSVVQKPGLNQFVLRRANGSAFWLKLQNGAPKERWAFEALTLSAVQAGRKRVRN